MGLVSFSDRACREVSLTEDTSELLRAVKHLTAEGNTNHQLALQEAREMLACSCASRKIVILFTDGPSNLGCPDPTAEAMKREGIEIFCIGLGVREQERWASCPKKEHCVYAEEPRELLRAFETAGAQVLRCRIEAPEIFLQLSPCFQLAGAHSQKGRIRKKDDRTLSWQMDCGGELGPETLCLHLEIVCCCREKCRVPLFETLCYRNKSCGCLCFPIPETDIHCSCVVPAETCPGAGEVWGRPCWDRAEGCVGEVSMQGLGRIVQVQAVIRDVCPGRALAVAVILSELDPCGKEHSRGMKTYEVPTQPGDSCRDVTLSCIPFVVPESTARWEDPGSLCKARRFRVRVLANYLDTDYTCCEGEGMVLTEGN